MNDDMIRHEIKILPMNANLKKKTKNFVYQYKKQINDVLYDHMISQDFSNSIQTLTLHYDLQVYLYNN